MSQTNAQRQASYRARRNQSARSAPTGSLYAELGMTAVEMNDHYGAAQWLDVVPIIADILTVGDFGRLKFGRHSKTIQFDYEDLWGTPAQLTLVREVDEWRSSGGHSPPSHVLREMLMYLYRKLERASEQELDHAYSGGKYSFALTVFRGFMIQPITVSMTGAVKPAIGEPIDALLAEK
jgi:hypothetical protein